MNKSRSAISWTCALAVGAACSSIRLCLMASAGRAHLEASAERWSRLLGLLEELWRWICLKDEELAKQMPLGGDVPTLLQQQNYCTVRSATSPPLFGAVALIRMFRSSASFFFSCERAQIR